MKKKVKWIKWLIHFPCLFISMVMVMDTLYHWSNKPLLQYFFLFVAIVIELVAQYFRGMITLHIKHKLSCYQLRVLGYSLGVCLYIVAFAYPSAVRVFKNEIKFINQKHEAITFSIEETRAEYKEVKADIKRYERYRDEEEPSGKLGKFNKYEDEVKRLKTKRDELKKQIDANNNKQSEMAKTSVTQVDNSVNLMFIAALIMVYGGLFLTPWNIPASVLLEEEEEDEEGSSEPPAPQTITSNALAKVPEVMVKHVTTMKYSGEREKMMEFARSLYNVDAIEQLRSFNDVYNTVRPLGITYRECDRFLKQLNELGAIETTPGRNSRGIWKVDEIIEYLERVG